MRAGADMPGASGAPPADGTAEAPDVEAIVLAAGRGERLGLGPKALLTLGGRTLLERAVAVMLTAARRVVVGVPEACVDDCVERMRAQSARRVVVVAGGTTRMETTLRLFRATTAPLIVQHDVVHPFVTEDMTRQVLAAARRSGAALVAGRSGAHVYRGRDTVTERVPTTDGLWLAQKPLAFSRDALTRAVATRPTVPDGAGVLGLLLAAGQAIEIVAGEPWNVKISTASDWALAQILDPALAAGTLGAAPRPAAPDRVLPAER